MIITFIGHSKLPSHANLSENLEKAILQKLPLNENVSFYCGGYGEFDLLCAKVCRAIAAKRERCEVLLITPYITESAQKKLAEIKKTKLYDDIIYPPIERTPLRLAILKRNEWMIAESNLVIAFVTHSFGGAYKALEFARRKGKPILNLALDD